MTKTLEITAAELAEKLQRGEISPLACVRLDLDLLDTQQTKEEIAQRVASLQRFFEESAISDVVVDDSREGISGQDSERE